MKAIINVNKNSSYSHFNGKTFEVFEVANDRISIKIEGITTDFSFLEIIIVNIDKEWNYAVSQINDLKIKLYSDKEIIKLKEQIKYLQYYIQLNCINLDD